MKKVLLCLILFSGFSVLNAQGRFSDAAQISILLASPGTDLYAAFGHCGIRVKDPNNRLDVVFDYGVFDFNTPNFYGKFIRGKLLYQLAVRNFDNYWRSYVNSDQEIMEYTVMLDTIHKRQFISALLDNYKPENRKYLYDFFYDNCATRIRDLLEDTGEQKLIIPEEQLTTLSLRDLLHYSLVPKPWSAFGIDIILGLEADRTANQRRRVFIPFWLMETLSKYQLVKDGRTGPLLSEPDMLKEGDPLSKPSFWASPLFIVSLCCSLLLLASIFFRNHSASKWIDRFLFLVSALSGLFILFLWFGTDHLATRNNLNMLWLNPLYLFLIRSVGSWKGFTRIIAIGLLAINIFILAGSNWLWPQYVHPGFYPIIGLLIVRLFFNLNTKLDMKK